MSIKLVFNGGLFVVLPGKGEWRKVISYLARPDSVKVTHPLEGRKAELEEEITSAHSVDFISVGPLVPVELPMRHLSHCLAIDYNRFRKVVGFTGGRVSSDYDGKIPAYKLQAHADAKSADDVHARLAAYKTFHGIEHDLHDEYYVKDGIVDAFAETEDTRLWVEDYRVKVELASGKLRLALDGRAPKSDLVDGVIIELFVTGEGDIPHRNSQNPSVVDNPHVLEQPPTF